ncbi:MAG: hypothetical protein DRN95_08500 [Candidatus Hydrothermarchaeota archaeon]|nr:MAG: hypothetical protein DRN95_08500 [Candidatus Hydrothermarchaeota archaeon]
MQKRNNPDNKINFIRGELFGKMFLPDEESYLFKRQRVEKNMDNKFREIFKGKVVIVGIGNSLKGDDGVGLLVIEELKKRGCSIPCINAGVALESYMGKIIKESPDTVLIIDATHLGRSAGTWELLEPEDIIKSGFTTHDMSARMFLEYLQEVSGTKVYMLGIQPQNVDWGKEITEVLRERVEEIVNLIMEAEKCMNHI